MKIKFSTSTIKELKDYLLIHLGLNFSEKQEKELMQKMNLAAHEFEFNNVHEFVQWILENELTDQQHEILASYLTIGETYFLREKLSYEFLEYDYLSKLINRRKGKDQRLRIWCAGCATGEEPYTIAILVQKLIKDIENWNITILATDINPKFLEKARHGVYTKWSFRNNPDWFKDKYFIKQNDNQYQIRPEIKQMVTFMPHNLIKDNYPSVLNNTNAMDIIFCRNVLIYFSQVGMQKITERFYKSLIKGGILIVGSVEMSHIISTRFSKINYSGFTIYSKDLTYNENTATQYEIQAPKSETKDIYPIITNKVLDDLYTKEVIKSEQELNIKIEKVIEEQLSDYEQAIEFYNQGLYDRAEELLLGIKSKQKENNDKVNSYLAKIKANLGQLEEAKFLCDEAIELNKTDYSLYYLKATITNELNDDNDTLALLQRTIYLNPDFALAYFLLGSINIKKGKNSEGMKCFQNALKVLSKSDLEEILPESEGLTVGRLSEVINAIK